MPAVDSAFADLRHRHDQTGGGVAVENCGAGLLRWLDSTVTAFQLTSAIEGLPRSSTAFGLRTRQWAGPFESIGGIGAPVPDRPSGQSIDADPVDARVGAEPHLAEHALMYSREYVASTGRAAGRCRVGGVLRFLRSACDHGAVDVGVHGQGSQAW